MSKTPIKADLVALADSACTVGKIPVTDIISTLQEPPELFVQILKTTSEKISLFLQELERTSFGTAKIQIATILLTMARGQSYIDISQERLARISGKTRVTVASKLYQFELYGAISLERSRIIIKDVHKLEELAEEGMEGRMPAVESSGC